MTFWDWLEEAYECQGGRQSCNEPDVTHEFRHQIAFTVVLTWSSVDPSQKVSTTTCQQKEHPESETHTRFGVRQTDDKTTQKSTRWNIYRAALHYAWGPADVASDTRRVCTHQLRRMQEPPGVLTVRIRSRREVARDGARASKPEWPILVPTFYGHHDLSTLLLGKVSTKRSELVDTVEPTSS